MYMKRLNLPLFLVSIFAALSGSAETTTKWIVEIPDSNPGPQHVVAPHMPVPIDYRVIRSSTSQIDVAKVPELPGLPAVRGSINVTLELVEEPISPPPPPRFAAPLPVDPAVSEWLAELAARHHGTDLVFLSATVFDNKRTFLKIYPNGRVADAVTAWSNLDFNHFTAFTLFRVTDGVDGGIYDYGLLMGVSRRDTRRMADFTVRKGIGYMPPAIPEMPDLAEGGPAFTVVDGDSDSPAMATLEQLHDLYRTEGPRMAAASRAREKALAERRAYLLANPPVPEDVTIRIWERDVPATHSRKKTSP